VIYGCGLEWFTSDMIVYKRGEPHTRVGSCCGNRAGTPTASPQPAVIVMASGAWVDGSRFEYAAMSSNDSIATLKERLSRSTGVARSRISICRTGTFWDDRSSLATAGAHNECMEAQPELMCWGRRYSAHRSEYAMACMHTREAQKKQMREVANMRHAVREVYLGIWLVVGRLFKLVGFGAPQCLTPDGPVWQGSWLGIDPLSAAQGLPSSLQLSSASSLATSDHVPPVRHLRTRSSMRIYARCRDRCPCPLSNTRQG
jgi:hypothetical protein